MLNILTISNNFPYILGLNSLFKIVADKKNIDLFFLLKSEPGSKERANVIIIDSIVSISVFKHKESVYPHENMHEEGKVTLHIPFMWKQDNLAIIMSKIEKIAIIQFMKAASSQENQYWIKQSIS